MSRIVTIAAAVIALGLANQGFAQDKPNFEEATRAPYNSPPDKSINGKSISEMKDKVKEMWSGIVFEKDGKVVDYVVVLDTDAGPIELEFFPQDAPIMREASSLSRKSAFSTARSFIAAFRTS